MVPTVDENGKEVNKGVRLDAFFYTGKMITTLTSYNKKKKITFTMIKCMPDVEARSKGWMGEIKRKKSDNEVFMEDNLCFIKGIASTLQKRLENVGLKIVQDLAVLDDDSVHLISNQTGISSYRISKFRANARQAKQGASDYPKRFDFRQDPNPFESRYGNEWEIFFATNNMTGMRDKVCITTLIEHMDTATAKAYKGTIYEHTYMWSHDALSQMIDRTCIAWMKKRGLYHRWLKPEMGISDEVFGVKEGILVPSGRYSGRPVGNSPELMPLDNSLFRDFRTSLNLHIGLTAHLPDTDVRKYSKSTPNRLDKAVQRLWDPERGISPRPCRIVQDIGRLPSACMQIVEHGGGVVPGLAERTGHRRGRVGTKNDRRCRPDAERKKNSKKSKTTMQDLHLMPDVQIVVKDILTLQMKKIKLSQTDRISEKP